MSYVRKPTYIETISKFYPTRVVVCSSDPHVYENVVFVEGDQIPELELTALLIEYYKSLIITQIRDDARTYRNISTLQVLGTDDAEQLRTYDEKYSEAAAYMVYNETLTPIMDAETSHTGETVETLAPMVVEQYESAKMLLRTAYGNIEGVRRANITVVSAFTTTVELEAYNGPTWS